MAVTIKSPREIELMREAGKILAKTHDELAKNLKPGMSTWDIDHMVKRSYEAMGVSLPLRITTATLRQSVYRSMTRWYTGFRTGSII